MIFINEPDVIKVFIMKCKILSPKQGLLIHKRPLSSPNYMHWMFISYIASICFFFGMILMLDNNKDTPLPERSHIGFIA